MSYGHRVLSSRGFGERVEWAGGAIFIVMIALLAGFTSQTLAQEADDVWVAPINLSQSGAATAPLIVADASGVLHVLWRDNVENSLVYRRREGAIWGASRQVELPFGTRQNIPDLVEGDSTPLFEPTLIADESGQIHAFWLDGLGDLQYSAVASEEFSDLAAWLESQTLAQGVLELKAAIDDAGGLHLAYVRRLQTNESPAGVYYMRSSDAEAGWSEPVMLYESPYFRVLSKANANLQLTVTGATDTARVYSAWDNPSLDRVFLAHSRNGGVTWTEPSVIDEREAEDDLNSTGPSRILIVARGANVHLTWQAGHESEVCAQYHLWSDDGGQTWQPRERILDGFQGCPVENRFITRLDSDIMLLTTGQTDISQGVQPHLVAWNGTAWSEPQPQATLASFVSADTFRPVSLACLEVAVPSDDELIAIGCGQAQDEDIWLTSRSLGSTIDWFPPPAIWSTPEKVANINSRPSSLEVVADLDGLIHAIWSQAEPGLRGSIAGYYSRWEGQQWSQSTPVLHSLEGNVQWLAAALGRGNRLMAVWSEDSGSVYYSRAEAAGARIPSEWSPSVALPVPRAAVAAADIAVNRVGTIYVAYNLPVNESRGVYVVRSDNGGQTWSLPVTVFDAESAGWDIVGAPQLAISGNGLLHVQWSRETRTPGFLSQATALFYARSDDAGISFHEPEAVVEAPISWSVIEGEGERIVHRLWQESGSVGQSGAALTSLLHQRSEDGGLTWSQSVRVSGQAGPTTLVRDGGDGLHLLQLSGDGLRYWSWSGNGWLSKEGQRLAGVPDSATAAVTSDGQLVVVYGTDLANQGVGTAQYEVASIQRTDQLPAEVPTRLPSLTPTPTSTPTVTPTPGPQPTPTPILSSGTGNPGLLGSVNVWIASAVPAAVLVLAVVARGLLALRGRQG